MNKNAKWIAPPTETEFSAVTFRRELTVQKPVKAAKALISALGVYVFELNGKRVGNDVLAPGWTVYNKRVQYQAYDVTSLLSPKTQIDVSVGPGWALSEIGFKNNHHHYSKNLALLATIDILYEDGSHETVLSDENWEVLSTHVTFSQIYHGETVDMTAPIRSLGKAILSPVTAKAIPQVGERIVENERIAPVQIITTPKGERVIDFGQNLTGYVEIRIQGKRGDRVVLHHAEVLDKDGNFYTENMRNARNENVYILSGDEDVFKPSYTFQGFRYVQLVEYPFDEIDPDAFRAIVVHSKLKRTGRFACGNAKINQLYHNIVWGQKGNYLDIPTDCPQRNERLGWLGDAQVFCRTAAINFDVEKFFVKWLGDVALEQKNDGSIEGVVPNVVRTATSAAWGDVICIAPYQLYLAYGNKKELKKCLPMMEKWVNFLHGAGPEEFLWIGGKHYGDWLAMDGDPDDYVGKTPTDFIASAFFAYSTSLLVKCGTLLGEDVSQYEELYQNVRKAFRARYVKKGKLNLLPNGAKDGDPIAIPETQTAYTLLLHFDLAEEEEKAYFAKQLVRMIKKNGMRMTTGFVGTPYLLHVLSENGYHDVAYKLLLQEKNPSWLYSVNHGATTMWEHWNSLKEDGSFWSTDMNSFNHYAYGAVYDWIFGVALGIQPLFDAPAYQEIRLEPHPCKELGFARASIESRNGFILSHWYYKEDRVYYEFEIPEGVTAHLRLPSGRCETLKGGIYHFVE